MQPTLKITLTELRNKELVQRDQKKSGGKKRDYTRAFTQVHTPVHTHTKVAIKK